MVVVVGLGNFGAQFKDTYHNVGFMIADGLAQKLDISFKKEKYKSQICEGVYKGEKVLIAKPLTYMNNSGEAVVLIKKKYKDARILVAVDDVDLAQGVVRYREKGSSGTHNGLRSIVSFIGENFERVRLGVGRDEKKDLADYVLSKFSDKTFMENAIEKAVDLILEKIKV